MIVGGHRRLAALGAQFVDFGQRFRAVVTIEFAAVEQLPLPLHTLVDDLVVIHGETLPLSLSLPNTNAPPEVVHDAAQVLDQCLLFRLDHRHQPLS